MESMQIGPRRARQRKPFRFSWKWAVVCLVVAVVGFVAYTASLAGTALEQMSTPLPAEVPKENLPAPVKEHERINILVMGLDDDRLRSDTMMVVSVDTDAKKVGVLQIPRDTRALLAGKGTLEKINGAYASGVGDKLFPANLRALKTVEDLLDVDIHYTAVVDLDGFRKIINELGGITIDVPIKMDYDDPDQNLHIHIKPGRQKLDGKQALEFVRFRHNNDGTGYPDQDLGRIRAQQQFMKAVLDEMLKPANIPLIPARATMLARYIETTMEPNRIVSLAKTIATVRREDIEFATLPGVDAYVMDAQTSRRLSFYLPDPERTGQLVDRLIRGR